MNKNLIAVFICGAFLTGCASKPANHDVSNNTVNEQAVLSELKDGVSLQFANNSSHIDPKYESYLAAAAKGLAQNSSVKLKLDGHTDGSGTVATNKRLSLARANSVATTLVAQYGVNPDQLITEGFASTKPVASNSTAEGRAMNRRVDITLHTP